MLSIQLVTPLSLPFPIDYSFLFKLMSTFSFLAGKIFKLKKLPNKNKSSGAIVTTSKRKHHSGKKRSQSDDSSNDDNELSESGEDETQSNASPRRCRTGKKASNGKVSGKRTKLAAAVVDDSCDEDEESDLGEKEEANLKKGKALKRNICGNGAKKQTKKKSLSSKQTKGVKSKTKKQIDSDDESNEDEEDHDDNMSDGEEVADQNLTDDAVVDEEEEETHESDNERRPKATKGNSKGKEKKGKASGKAPARTGKVTKPNASKPKASKGTKKNEKVASKKNVKDQSDDDTEESEHEDGNAEKKDVEVPPAHWTKASDNVKSKCDKSKAKTVTEAANTRSATECPVKDVYTFELSPAEVPTATTTRLVLSSSHESRSRQESHLRVSESSDPSTGQTDGLHSVSLSTGVSVNTNSPVPIKSSFSPQIVADGPVHKEGPAFEPLPPDAFSRYEPPFGPNASLSSLSQLSQSIGGGAGHGGGPILLNHQAPTNKCPLNIKEEPKEESPTSIRLAHPKVAVHETPPPVVVEHLSASQHFGPSVNSKNAHSRRMWSNARYFNFICLTISVSLTDNGSFFCSTGSLISSSSSSSSSPVHLAFGQCPPAPPTPATPASLANFFTPSNSLPVLTSSFYPPNSKDTTLTNLFQFFSRAIYCPLQVRI